MAKIWQKMKKGLFQYAFNIFLRIIFLVLSAVLSDICTESRSITRIPKTATISFVKSKRIFNDFIIYFLQAFEIASKVWLSAWASSREESKVGVST